MTKNATAPSSPAEGIWKRFLLLVPLLLVLAACSYLYIRPRVGTYTARGVYGYTEEEIAAGTVTFSDPGVVEVLSVESAHANPTVMLVRFAVLADGRTEATFTTGDKVEDWTLEVRDGAIIEGGINFEGWQAIHVSLSVFLGAVVLLFLSALVKLWRVSWYGYTMVACGGGLLFCLFQFLLFTMLLVRGAEFDFRIFLSDVTDMVLWFSALSVYPMLPMALLVSISNISLIRHEGMRPVNLLGIAASILWVVAYGYWVTLYNPTGPMAYVTALIPLAIAYGECLLLSTILCAWLASRHVPKHAMDYLVILGCGIRADGTPCPLLAGRVDRARAFDESRVAMGDAPATFVPSGGQGPDEPISEAQSMGTYLEGKGVPSERIVLEDHSTTTRENMAFSREVIEHHAGRSADELSIGFSTTNYHVFRGYVCAHQAGMAVEGVGSKTKYYFWPNAFLREFVGLLAHRWKNTLGTFLLLSAIYLFATYVLGHVIV